MQIVDSLTPVAETAKLLIRQTCDWADANISTLDHVQYFAIGSVFREDFNPERSDFDIVVIANAAAVTGTIEVVEMIKHVSSLMEQLRNTLGDNPLISKIPISPSLYFTNEIAAGIHRTGDRQYFNVNQFARLTNQRAATDWVAAGINEFEPRIPEEILIGIGFAQQFRHIYLLQSDKRGTAVKPWEKLFHHLRALLRLSGVINRSAPVPSKQEVLALAEMHLAQYKFPCKDLTASLSNGFDVAQVDFDILLIAYESLREFAWSIYRDYKSRWRYFETREFASTSLIPETCPHDLFAIDTGFALYIPPGFSPISKESLEIQPQVGAGYYPDRLINPSRSQIASMFMEHWNDDITGYLHEQAIGGAEGNFQTKVGISRLDLPVPRADARIKLFVYPLSYWVIEAFNRRMVPGNDKFLREVQRKCLDGVLSHHQIVYLPFPSALYFEVALVTSDDHVIFLKKSSALSVLARNGFLWTCTLEEGFVWNRDIKASTLDLTAVMTHCLLQELGVDAKSILELTICGIALEAPLLNSAVVGIVKLNLSNLEFAEKVRSSPDFAGQPMFIHIDDIFCELFGSPGKRFDDECHPLARLRALFVYYLSKGRSEAVLLS